MSMRIIVAPGAFKNSLTAQQAAEAIARGLQQSGLDASLVLAPVADGRQRHAGCHAGGRRRAAQPGRKRAAGRNGGRRSGGCCLTAARRSSRWRWLPAWNCCRTMNWTRCGPAPSARASCWRRRWRRARRASSSAWAAVPRWTAAPAVCRRWACNCWMPRASRLRRAARSWAALSASMPAASTRAGSRLSCCWPPTSTTRRLANWAQRPSSGRRKAPTRNRSRCWKRSSLTSSP